MKSWVNKSKKFILTTIFLVGLGTLAPSGFANAQWGLIFSGAGNAFFKALTSFAELIVVLFTKLFALIVTWFASILGWVFQIQAFTTVPAVETGWTIARDFANMLFILVLLVIGFATIIRYESYGIKKLLPRLIIIALLVNFSLLLAGVVIDIGNDLGLFFVQGGSPNPNVDIGANMMAAIGVHRAANITPELETEIQNEFADGDTAKFLQAIMRLVLTMVVGFLFLAMALIMIFRMVALWILLIFLPLALVVSIVPAGMKIWSDWIQNFLKWAFFPAIFGLFIYIGILVGDAFNPPTSPIQSIIGSTNFQDGRGIFALTALQVLQYIVVVSILFMGLSQANKWGLAGAKGSYNLAVKTKDRAIKGATGYARRKGISVGGRATEAALYKKDAEGRRTVARGFTRALSYVPGARKAPAQLMQARRKQIEEYEKEYESIAKSAPQQLKLMRGKLSGDRQVAIDRALAKNGNLKTDDLLSEGQVAASMKRATTLGMNKELVLARPDIAIDNNIVQPTMVQKMLTNLKPGDIQKISGDVFEGLRDLLDPAEFNNFMDSIASSWKSGHIRKMADEGQTSNLNEMRNYMRSFGGANPADRGPHSAAIRLNKLRDLNPGLADWLTNSPGAADFIDLG